MCEQEEKDIETMCCSDDTDMQEQAHACEELVKEWQDKFARVSADLQNYKRRMASEQMLWGQRAQNEILVSLLSIVDDFDRALQTTESDNEWIKGFVLIHAGLEKLLASYGVKPMENNTEFNPEFHEAIMQIDSQDHTSGSIVEVLQKGYMRNDTVLRPAKVSVAK